MKTQSLTPHQSVALDISKSVSLTANAGSGKTYVLAKRYLEIAVKADVPLKNIAAITFTEKAAGELYKKISEEIDLMYKSTSDNLLKKKLRNIRRQLVSASISTIHSFCLDILREYPVEAELDANFIPIDTRASGELLELAVEETIKKLLISEDNERIKSLYRLFSSKHLLAKELIKLVEKRKNVIELNNKIYHSSHTEIAIFFHDSFIDLAQNIYLLEEKKFWKHLNIINEKVLDLNTDNQIALKAKEYITEKKDNIDIKVLLKFVCELKTLTIKSNGEIKERGYLSKKVRDGIQESITKVEVFFKDISKLVVDDDHQLVETELAKYGKSLINAFAHVLAEYETKKRENGFLDYEDILIKTKNILQNEYVKEALSEKYKYLMVDEYQDTNEIQYKIFLPILDYLKKGNLFVVGDEKQSIYQFRDAELEVFERTKLDIVEEYGKNSKLLLPDSFRMAPKLCLFTNYIFKEIFKDPKTIYNEVQPSSLICARDNDFDGKVEILLADENDDNAEADLVAKRIVQLVNGEFTNRGKNWNNIAVLVRKRSSFASLEKSFTKFNIPYSIIGGKGFYQQQAIYDIYNYFSFLLNKENDTALIGVLRSPFFTVSDSVLFELSFFDGNNYWQKISNAKKQISMWNPIAEQLEENLLLSHRVDISFLLRKILSESDFLPVISSKKSGVQELANINKLVKITVEFENQGFRTLYDYVNFLADAIDSSEEEAQASLSEDKERVNILTIHQAKGLEFSAVFLFNSHHTSAIDSVKSKSVSVSKNYGLLTKVPLQEDYFSDYKAAPIVNAYNLVEEKKNIAEIKRLFYVAVTRAEDYLFISSSATEKFKASSFMHLLEDGLQRDIDSNEIELHGELEFLMVKESIYQNEVKKLKIIIPVVNNIKNFDITGLSEEKKDDRELFSTKPISDIPEGEIFSATKLSIFHQCPVKYRLIYDLGFSELFKRYNKWQKKTGKRIAFEFKPGEDSIASQEEEKPGTYGYSDVKGIIIHSALEKQISPGNLNNFVKDELDKLLSFSSELANLKGGLNNEIVNYLIEFYQSEEFKYLNSFKYFYNELKVYLNEEDYYLYGIIDKLILDDGRLTIVDYKTDDIEENEIKERADNYITQLKFYAYIVRRLFKDVIDIQLRIVFLKHPTKAVIINLSEKERGQIKQEIKLFLDSVRKNNFIPNSNHCSSCSFSINYTTCIYKYSSSTRN